MATILFSTRNFASTLFCSKHAFHQHIKNASASSKRSLANLTLSIRVIARLTCHSAAPKDAQYRKGLLPQDSSVLTNKMKTFIDVLKQ